MKKTKKDSPSILDAVKSIISEDLVNFLISLFLSVILYLGIIAIRIIVQDGKLDFIYFWNDIFIYENAIQFLCIVILTLLVWFITGIIKRLKQANYGLKSMASSLFMFLLFIIGVFLYVFNEMLEMNTVSVMVYRIYAVIAFIYSVFYFQGKSPNKKNELDSNNRIA